MKYNVLTMGYADPNPEKIKELLLFEESYLKRNYSEKQQKNILIFSYVILHETEEINAATLAAARKSRIEYNLSFKELDTKPDNHAIHKFTIEI